MWIIAILFSLTIKKPMGMLYPPRASYILKQLNDDNTEKTKTLIALQFDEATLAQKIIGLNKASKLQNSYRFMVSALVVFLVSFLLVIFGIL